MKNTRYKELNLKNDDNSPENVFNNASVKILQLQVFYPLTS